MDKAKIAAKLIELRGERRREEVAAAVGISVSALTMYETAGRIPRDEVKISLADFYHTSVGDIFFS